VFAHGIVKTLDLRLTQVFVDRVHIYAVVEKFDGGLAPEVAVVGGAVVSGKVGDGALESAICANPHRVVALFNVAVVVCAILHQGKDRGGLDSVWPPLAALGARDQLVVFIVHGAAPYFFG